MTGITTRRFASAALIGLCELCVFPDAFAGQPLEKVGIALNRTSTEVRPDSKIQSAGELDLRPPPDVPTAMSPSGLRVAGWFPGAAVAGFTAAGARSAVFPAPGAPSAVAPAGSSASEGGHLMSPMQLMAHNFRQQGLPLAKLFENKDSLVHLGLNQKGKPGLWIVHKLH